MNSAILTALPEPEPERNRLDYREVTVTPQMAQVWLGLNTSNRKLKLRTVEAYKADMVAGRWRVNGEFVKFAGPSYAPRKLLDGQNRLHAVMKAGIPVDMCIAFNVPEPTQVTMDSGSKRTVADNLTIDGQQNANVVAPAAALALRVATDGLAKRAAFTTAAVAEFVEQNPSLHVSASVASQFARKADIAPSLVAYTHWVLGKINLDQATAFWRDAAEKVGLEAGDPVIALTNRFAEARRNKERVPDGAALSAIYRAWNARREGKPMLLVRVNSSAGGYVGIPEPK